MSAVALRTPPERLVLGRDANTAPWEKPGRLFGLRPFGSRTSCFRTSCFRASCFRTSGFTLLEILAVMLIGGLLMSFAVPNLSVLNARALEAEADKLVATIDLGRQRSVMTGSPHQLVIDIEAGGYVLEWELAGPPAETKRRPAGNRTYRSEDSAFTRSDQISLSPPDRGEGTFVPIPGLLGRFEVLPGDIEFEGIQTIGGWVNSGQVTVRFERDGSSSFTTIVIGDSSGYEAHLEILPLADSVRINYEES